MRTLILLAASALLVAASEFTVVFETMQCNGDRGFASVAMENVSKIESGSCVNPNDAKQKLRQMLVKNERGSYDTFSLTQEAAEDVMVQIRAYNKARLENLQKANTLIISK
ncbi:MAG: hypothetical protein JXK05_10660 [Campylobacterales bacterium]|nr:hypothetical protein [Campylobacterales bacterium]